MQGATIIKTALILSVIPIWREGSTTGLNFWDYLKITNQKGYEPFGSPHISYSEAVQRAHAAWEQANG
jgi:hypothetical protein